MAAVAPSSPATLEPKLDKSEQDNPTSISQDASPVSAPAASAAPSAPVAAVSASGPTPENPSSNPAAAPPNPPVVTPHPPSMPSFTPSFRPVGAAPPVPQFSPLPNPNLANPGYQVPGLHPPGVSTTLLMVPGAAAGAGAGAVTVTVAPLHPPGVYQVAPGQLPAAAPGSYMQPNGYMTVSGPVPQAPSAIPPPAPSFGSW